MANDWKTACVQCGAAIGYADEIAALLTAEGAPRPAYCAVCDQALAHERRATAMDTVGLAQTDGLQRDSRLVSPLGNLPQPARRHHATPRDSQLEQEKSAGKFGVKDDELRQMFAALSNPQTPVLIAVAPTGSGKSTLIPYRLLFPSDPESLCMHGQIVITQPRRAPVVGVSGYVAGSLLGSAPGLSYVIGYRHADAHGCDRRNQMVYVTDGTLINWLARGELDRIGLIMIDEAHERNVNIDVILAMLTHVLPRYPHLKVLIASATIDHIGFKRHFDRRLGGGLRAEVVECSGGKPVRLTVHFRKSGLPALPYDPQELRTFTKRVAGDVADAVLLIVRRMLLGRGRDGISDGPDVAHGDVISFLHGAAEIDAAVAAIRAGVEQTPEIAERVHVYRLHANVPKAELDVALGKQANETDVRVFVATNAAETSLTIDGIVHVVESGMIKQASWDPITESKSVPSKIHSQAGCRQRMGRAGRKTDGYAWLLYTEPQFDNPELFEPNTVPELLRSPLNSAVLTAKAIGADAVDGARYPWLSPPDDAEIERTLKRLKRIDALDDHGDLTPIGLAMRHDRGAANPQLMRLADRFGFGIEIATLLPMIGDGLRSLFEDDKSWDNATVMRVRGLRRQLRARYRDDLELCLRVFHDWKTAPLRVTAAAQSETFAREWHQAIGQVLWSVRTEWREVPKPDRRALVDSLCRVRGVEELRALARDPAGVQDAVIGRLQRRFDSLIADLWARSVGVSHAFLTKISQKRDEMILKLGSKKKLKEDRDPNFGALDRLRLLFARALSDCVYVRVDADTGARISESNADDESGQEDLVPLNPAPEAPEHVLQIGNLSSAFGGGLLACVACGRLQNVCADDDAAAGEGDSAKRTFRSSFIVAVDPDGVAQALALDEFGLAEFFAARYARQAVDAERETNLAANTAVRERFPVGARVECEVIDRKPDGNHRVRLVRTVEWDATAFAPKVADPTVDDPDTERINLDDACAAFYSDADREEVSAAALAAPEPEIDPIDEAINGQKDIETGGSEPEDQPESGVVARPPELTTEHAHTAAADEETLARTIKAILEPHGVDGDMPAGRRLVVDVLEHRLDAEGTRAPRVRTSAVPMAARFVAFAERYQVGDIVSLHALRQEPDGQQLRVKEPATGLETTVTIRELAPTTKYSYLATIPEGAVLDLRVCGLDAKAPSVRFDGLYRLDPILERIALQPAETAHDATVCEVDVTERATYVHLVVEDASEPSTGIVIPARIRVEADRRESGQTFRRGSRISVRLSFPTQTEKLRSSIQLSPERIQELATRGVSVDSRLDSRLVARRRLTFEDLEYLSGIAEELGGAHTAYGLYHKSNTPRAELVLTDLQRRCPVGKTFECMVTGCNSTRGRDQPGKVLVRLDVDVKGEIAADAYSWYMNRLHYQRVPVGSKLQAVVSRVDVNQQIVHLDAKHLEPNPWKGHIKKDFAPGKTVIGCIDGFVAHLGLFVKLNDEFLRGLVHVSSLSNEVREWLEKNDGRQLDVQVRVFRLNTDKQEIGLNLLSDVDELRQAAAERGTVLAAKGDNASPATTVDLSGSFANLTSWPWDDGRSSTELKTAAHETSRSEIPEQVIGPAVLDPPRDNFTIWPVNVVVHEPLFLVMLRQWSVRTRRQAGNALQWTQTAGLATFRWLRGSWSPRAGILDCLAVLCAAGLLALLTAGTFRAWFALVGLTVTLLGLELVPPRGTPRYEVVLRRRPKSWMVKTAIAPAVLGVVQAWLIGWLLYFGVLVAIWRITEVIVPLERGRPHFLRGAFKPENRLSAASFALLALAAWPQVQVFFASAALVVGLVGLNRSASTPWSRTLSSGVAIMSLMLLAARALG